MNPYTQHDISQDDIDSVIEVFRSGWLTQGPKVPEFEQLVASYCGANHAVAVNSATSALHIACVALDLGPKDWLWTSPNTFVASANCARYCGAYVDFVDIDPYTYNMSADLLAAKLEQAEKDGRLPKIVVPVHFAGQPCDMPAIKALSQKYGFAIIEDASHALGARYEISDVNAIKIGDIAKQQSMTQIKVGSCTHSDITVFSFHPVKMITTGEGGMVLTNNDDLAKRLQRTRTHGITSDKELMDGRPQNEIWNYQQIELGYNYRMTDIQAALGVSQIKRLDKFVALRHQIANYYDTELESLPITTPWQSPQTFSSYHLYPIRVKVGLTRKTQYQIYNSLRKNDIAVNLHYIPVHRQPYYENLGFRVGDFPESEQFHREVISLPIYPSLADRAWTMVVKGLQDAVYE